MHEKEKTEIIELLYNRLYPEIQSSVKAVHRTAPETKRKIDELDKCNKEQSDKIDHLVVMVREQGKMTTEMYRVFTSANWAGKFILKLFGGIGIIAGGIIGIIELCKDFYKK